jgi:hypothetical protein
MCPGNKETISELWFREKDDDFLKTELIQIIENGIKQDWDVRYMVNCMINVIPKEICREADCKGYVFLPCDQSEVMEYDSPKGKKRIMYEGLYSGVDEFGQSFADIKYNFVSSGDIKSLEDEFHTGSLFAWEDVVAREKDEDLAILSTGLSRGGRFQLLAGLPRERVPNIVMLSVLLGPNVHEEAYNIAKRMLIEWRGNKTIFRNRIRI